MKHQLKGQMGNFAAVIGLIVIALAVGLYIMNNQRLRIPLIEPKPVRMNVVLDNAQAVIPGQGQSAQVAGVQIGLVSSVKLEEGRAVVGLDIEPEYDDVVHTDARAVLRPRTGLKDMYVQIFPGDPKKPLAEDGFTIPLRRTSTDVDLDEILSVLDERVLEYVQLLVNGTGRGLRRRGSDLAEVFKRYEPTMRDLARVNKAVASESQALRRSITALARLNERLADKPQDLTRLVDASAATFEAFNAEDGRLRETIAELGPTLQQASSTLRAVTPFANELGAATRELTPAFQELDRANRAVRPFAREATPIIRERIRPFVRESRPVVRSLGTAANELSRKGFPSLIRSLRVFNTFLNMVSHNPNGREPAGKSGREEGYLFWLAWTSHLGVNLQNIDDANGPMRPLFLTGTCTTLTSLVADEPELEFLFGLSPALATACGNAGKSPLDNLPVDIPKLPDIPVATPSLPQTATGASTGGAK